MSSIKRSIANYVLVGMAGTTFMLAATAQASTCADFNTAKTKWESDMKTVGKTVGEYLSPNSGHTADERLGADYYDGQWVFQQIASYTGQTSPWMQYAEYARTTYVDQYLVPANFGAQGYRRFPHGMYYDYKAGGKTTLAQLQSLRDKPSLSNLLEYRDLYVGTAQSVSREVAYAIQANVYAERAGAARKVESGKSVPETLVGWTAEHFKQWQNNQYLATDVAQDLNRFAPFMAGLTGNALLEFIEWEEQNKRDPNNAYPSIEQSLRNFYNWMYDSATVKAGAATGQKLWTVDATTGLATFLYQDRPDSTGAAVTMGWELGNLIAYPYAWLAVRQENGTAAQQAEAQKFMKIADELFISTAQQAWIQGGGKFFNQSYRVGMLYMKLHNQSNLGVCADNAKPESPVLTVK